ncbi:hypothetical protein [uncultured Microscilla sp.]|uniref:hypothetical protein n=1 Tax=uncultured Microscilla sp. TaxID=432653 RepID=UPI002614ECF0|nr:hypothetical protein [uncultured Microscilla sp.]
MNEIKRKTVVTLHGSNITYSKKDLENFNRWCNKIEAQTAYIPKESRQEKEERKKRLLKPENYNKFFQYYFPHYCTDKKTGKLIDCAPYHLEIHKALTSEDMTEVAFMGHRGSAKSTHANVGFAARDMLAGIMPFMLLCGETEKKANRLLSDIQAEFQSNQRLINDYGKLVGAGDWTTGEFTTKTGIHFAAIGLGQNPRGIRKKNQRPTRIVCDDLDAKKRCNNPRLIDEAVDWINDDLMECFDKDIRQFIIVNNLIHKRSILAQTIKSLPEIKVFKINALDKKGNPTWLARYTKEYWAKIQKKKSTRSFSREYMNNPIDEGKIFKSKYNKWKPMTDLSVYDALVFYGDLSYTVQGDHKAMKLWGAKGEEKHRIFVFVRQVSRRECAIWLYNLYEEYNLKNFNIAYKFDGTFAQNRFVNDFNKEGKERGYYIPIVAKKKMEGNKFDKIEAIVGYWERGDVWYNSEFKDSTDEATELSQLAAFEKGSNAPDDAPDADAEAFAILDELLGTTNPDDVIIGNRESTGTCDTYTGQDNDEIYDGY